MNSIYIALVLSVFSFSSCQQKQSVVELKLSQDLDIPNIELKETEIRTNADSIEYFPMAALTEEEYDILQLFQVKDLEGYCLSDLRMGKLLLNNEYGKIVTINIITEGELTEYLLSYDSKGNLVDNLIVAYEDLVEYYTQISSILNSSEIKIQTVNFMYDEEDLEYSDTILIKYKLTPDLRFVVN